MMFWLLIIASGLFILAASVVLVLHLMRSAIVRDRTTNAFGRFDVGPRVVDPVTGSVTQFAPFPSSPEAGPIASGHPYRDTSAPSPPSDLEVLRGKRRHALEQAKMWRLRWARATDPERAVYESRYLDWEEKAVEVDEEIRELDENDDMEAVG